MPWLRHSQKGSSVLEYGLTLSRIAIVCTTAFLFGGSLFKMQ